MTLSIKSKTELQTEIQSDFEANLLSMVIPTGRIQEKVLDLLGRIGLDFSRSGRSYRPAQKNAGVRAKMLKAQNIPELVALGRHDCGFSGYDWIRERRADVVELLDLGFDPVRIVAAVPEGLASSRDNKYRELGRPLVIASEYRELTATYIEQSGIDGIYLQTFGATEALPPEDADMIVDNTATGATLQANRLVIVDELLRSTTRFICNRRALADPVKKRLLDEMVMLMESSLRARAKVLLEMNVSSADLERIVKDLPCMKAPTVCQLYGEQGYAVKVAVPKAEVPALVPRLVALGARDILEYRLERIVV
ncbi:MAG: ATP phosphoribosyltransferase [Candidatus Obscuribacterales bacterium]